MMGWWMKSNEYVDEVGCMCVFDRAKDEKWRLDSSILSTLSIVSVVCVGRKIVFLVFSCVCVVCIVYVNDFE